MFQNVWIAQLLYMLKNVYCTFFLIECFMQINVSQLKLLIHLCWLINNTLPDVSKSLHTISNC